MQKQSFPGKFIWPPTLFGVLLISVIVSFAPSTKHELLDTILHSLQPTVFVEAQTYATSRPTANPDTVTTPFNTPIDILPLTNDVNPIPNPLFITVVTNPANGTITFTNNTVSFTPTPGFVGTTTMNYSISNSFRSDASTITVNVLPNQPPVAGNDTATTDVNSPVNLNLPANDSDPDGSLNLPSLTLITNPSRGSVTVNPITGIAAYTPDSANNPDATNTDGFTYTVRDNNGALSNVATVTLTINRTAVTLDPQANTPVNTATTFAPAATPSLNLVRSGAVTKENLTTFGGLGAIIIAAIGVWLSIARNSQDQE
jgi:Bacterial Ig domain